MPLLDISIGVGPTATCAGVLLIAAAAAAAVEPATGVMIIAVTATSRISRMLVGAVARCCSVFHCVRRLLCRFALPACTLQLHGIDSF